MTKFFLSFLIVLSVASVSAQRTVSAAKIMDDIKKGKDISYENVTVTGVLDFTYHLAKADKYTKYAWWNGSNAVKEEIESEISFLNCTFDSDVLAYIHVEESGYTFTADFEKPVTFRNCEFTRNAMFKYSLFDESVDFSGSIFWRDNTFKYAEFESKATFSKATFKKDAIFKYAKFNEGVSFFGANFKEHLDIKYLNVSGQFDIHNMEVGHDIDAKYTEINGKSFAKYLYEARRN